MKNRNKKKNILIVHIGTIGDTLITMPAMRKICEGHPDCNIDFLNSPIVENTVHMQLFEGLDWFRRTMFNPTLGNIFQKTRNRCRIFKFLFEGHYDTVFYFSCIRPSFVHYIIFKILGIKKIIGLKYGETVPSDIPIGIFFLDLLRNVGISYDQSDLTLDLKFTDKEKENAHNWLASLKIPSGYRTVAVCVGSKRKACLWPIEKYISLLKRISPEYKLFPIIIGGENDRQSAEKILENLQYGAFSADSPLRLRETLIMLSQCLFYVGNDTGPIHMSAAAGIPCIGIYTDRIKGCVWKPSGDNHIIIRKSMECSDCKLEECRYGTPSRCLDMISVDEVCNAVHQMITQIDSPSV